MTEPAAGRVLVVIAHPDEREMAEWVTACCVGTRNRSAVPNRSLV